MRYLETVLLFFLLLPFTPSITYSQTLGGGGIVYGDDLGVGVEAPAGWIFDSTSGVEQGLHAVMYPEGTTWSKASEVMYVNIASLDEGQSLEEFIDQAIEGLKEEFPDLAVRIDDPIELEAGNLAQVRLYSGDQWGNSEAVAYAERNGSVAIYVLSCRSEPGFAKYLSTFREMVGASFLAEFVIQEEEASN